MAMLRQMKGEEGEEEKKEEVEEEKEEVVDEFKDPPTPGRLLNKYEPSHEKINDLHMRKQRHRSALQ